MMKKHLLLATCLLLPALRCPSADWGVDGSPGIGVGLIERARPEMLQILRAAEGDRPALAKTHAAKNGKELTEALKRFRNPEFRGLFAEMTRSGDWMIVHRGLLGLEMLDDPAGLQDAWGQLSHENARVREKAAITCVKLWNAEAGKKIAGGDAALMLTGIVEREKVVQVRRCLAALKARMDGKLAPAWVSPEFVAVSDDGLRMVPFLESFEKAATAVPGWRRPEPEPAGNLSAAGLPAADEWTPPVADWEMEVVLGVGMQAFGSQPKEGSPLHAGTDFGASLDGAGFYAVADGVVRLVRAGGPEGTVIVVEHNLGKGSLACSVYMHGGDAVFVKAEDKVSCGQLLGSMGMGFSTTNGGRLAHLHFGILDGRFDESLLAEDVPDGAGLLGWLDPGMWLRERIDEAKPPVEDPGVLGDAFETARRAFDKGDYGRAYVEGMKAGSRPSATEGDHESARNLKEKLCAGVREIQSRAQRKRDAGYPLEAMELLKKWSPKFRGVPGAADIDGEIVTWPKDPAYVKECSGARDIDGLEGRIAARKVTAEEAKAQWEGLLKKYGDTKLGPRIRAKSGLK